jgi:membrane protein DedA with SNARE-associated domain
MFRYGPAGRIVTHLDSIITALNNTDPSYLYLALFGFAFLENLFPPTPSDLVIAFGGSLVGMGKLGFAGALIASTLGSTAGFIVMYYIGFALGKRLIDSGRLSFLPLNKIKTAERWFAKYGYGLVVANRFLSGTRAVISFFVGLSELPVAVTLPLCALSALLWNSLLIYGGSVFGRNWKQLDHFLDLYGIVIGIIILLIAAVLAVRYAINRRHA